MSNGTIRLLDDPASFDRLGIDRAHPARREDALRMKLPLKPGQWEWWYSDAHFSNGDYCMVSFNIVTGDDGTMQPLIGLNIVRGGDKVCDMYVPLEPAQFRASEEHCEVVLGKSFFRGEGLDRYHIHVDPEENKGFGADLVFERTVPSYRPGTGRWDDGEHYFAWFCAVPGAKVHGKLLVGGESVEVSGSGYHDHNWGDVPMQQLLDNWLWGRAEIDGISVVASVTRFNAASGRTETPMLYAARGEEILLDVHGDELTCLEGVKVPHPNTGKLISSDCIYLVEGGKGQVRFRGRGQAVAAFKVAGAVSTEWETWYARYSAQVSVEVGAGAEAIRVSGEGVMENMDFFGRRVASTS